MALRTRCAICGTDIAYDARQCGCAVVSSRRVLGDARLDLVPEDPPPLTQAKEVISAITLRAPYGMPGTAIAYGAASLYDL
eukprot:3937140-Rhodomonas_salina.1